MVRTAEDYRKFVDLCLDIAEQTTDEATRKGFAQMASYWLELAHEAMLKEPTDFNRT